MSYVLEPYNKIPIFVEYNGKVIKFRKMYNEVKSVIDQHLEDKVNFWDSIEKKYNVGEPGLLVKVHKEPDDSDDETEEINWPKELWALYLTAVKFYKTPSEIKNLEFLEIELDDRELTDFDEIYIEIMDSNFSAKELYDEMGY